MAVRLAEFVCRHWKSVILIWLVALGLCTWLAPRWEDITLDGDLAYLPEGMTSVRGERLMAKAFPDSKAKSQIFLVIERPKAPLSEADFAVADRLADQFKREKGLTIVDIWSRQTEVVGDKLTSAPSNKGQATLVTLDLSNEVTANDNVRVLQEVERILDQERQGAHFPKGLQLGISGSAAIGGDTIASENESIKNIELATIGLVVLILVFVYRAPLLVIVPLLAIVVSQAIGMDLVAWLTQAHKVPGLGWLHLKVFKATEIFITVILFGGGTDYCLFLISRYKEELQFGLEPRKAASAALAQVGDAVAASAMTTIFGLGTMFFADFGKFQNSGPVIALCLFVALLACLTIAPAILCAGGRWIFWPFWVPRAGETRAHRGWLTPRGGKTQMSKFWEWAADFTVRHPGAIFAVSTLIMLPLAHEGLSVDISYDLPNDLQATRPSLVGTAMLRRHFDAGETGPIIVLANLANAGFDTRQGIKQIETLTKELYEVPGVVRVRSMAEPLGDRPAGFKSLFNRTSRETRAARRHPQARATFLTQVPALAGTMTRLDVVLDFDPFAQESIDGLGRIEAFLSGLAGDPESKWHGAEFEFLGTTAGIRDLKTITTSDQLRIQVLVVLAVLGVLIVLLRRFFISLYLILTVVFSYLVTIGATEVFCRWMYGKTFHGLDWKVPIFLFVILVAVGEDYNIYLITRVFEEQRRRGLISGLRQGVIRTGGIITSCGLIMAGSFVSMATGTLRAMIELGFALSMGIILDTFVVRPILVPAFLALVYRLRGHRLETTAPLDEDASEESPAPLEPRVRIPARAGRR